MPSAMARGWGKLRSVTVRCSERRCSAESLPDGMQCLAHVADGKRRLFLDGVAERGEGLGHLLRGVRVESHLLADLVGMISELQEPVDFTDASFPDVADFGDVSFRDNATFNGVTFESDVRFERAAFHGQASFVGAEFEGQAVFGTTSVGMVDRSGWGLSNGAQFWRDVDFGAAEFRGDALFEGVLLAGSMFLDRADFHAECRFDVLDYWLNVGDCVAPPDAPKHEISLRDARFRDGAVVVLPAGKVDATDVEIGDATRLEVSGPLVLDSISFPHPLVVEGAGRAADERAEIVSLRGSTLQAPVIIGNNVDLRRCRFTGTVGLEWLRLPVGDRVFSRHRNRWVLADEVLWRNRNRGPGRWRSERLSRRSREGWQRLGDDIDEGTAAQPEPSAIAGLYRQLRQGIEDSRNAPGAADFYYGEMEMRRASRNSRAEALTLRAYWALSGYGLRAWRSLTFLAAIIVGTSSVLATGPVGVREPCPSGEDCPDFDSFPASLVFVTRWSISLVPTPEVQGLSTGGEAVLVGTRMLTPILVALTVLAVRSRVHR